MNEFLNSVKDDLLDVRLRLLLFVLAAALVAAVAYCVLGGGSSSTTPTASTAPVSPVAGGISISQTTTNPAQSVTETTDGAAQKRRGPLRNPFTPLPTAKSATTTSPSSSSPPSSSPSGSSGASTGSGSTTSAGTTTPAPATKPTAPAKPRVTTSFKVTAQFGVLPATSIVGATVEPAHLKTYPNMALDEPLPDKTNPQLVYSGAVKHAKLEAVFTLTGESILHGNATCLPSATQCQAIRLQVGQSETLESVESDGSPVTYELRIVGIQTITHTVGKASAARAHVAAAHESKAGRELLQRKGLTKVTGLQYSPGQGVLVPETPPAPAARAHVAVQPPLAGR